MYGYIEHSHKMADCRQESEIIGVYGGFNFLTKKQVHDQIRQGDWHYFSRAPGVPNARLRAVGHGPDRYLQADADGLVVNNLINPPNC